MKQRFHRDTNEVVASLCALQRTTSNNQKSELEIAEYPATCCGVSETNGGRQFQDFCVYLESI